MLELSTTATQTVTAGQAITFDIAVWDKGCAEQWRRLTSAVVFDNCLPDSAIFEIDFAGNVGGTTAATAVQLQLTLGGTALPETLTISTPVAVGDLNNVANGTWVPGNAGNIALVNTGTTPIVIGPGFNMRIRRIA